MDNIIEVIKSRKTLFTLEGATELEIKLAEEELGVKFAQDYWELLSVYGVVSYEGHELVGICSSPRLNVIDVTIDERDKNPKVPMGMYVIEVTNIDLIVIWQSVNGEIYKTSMESEPVKLCDSLIEYVNILV
jgi:hypothetical protein